MTSDAERVKQEADRRYEAALAESGFSDVRPLYRKLLARLRDRDPERYERAVERYEEDLLREVAEGDEPLEAWIGYGRWLAEELAPGRTVAVDRTGRARDLSGEPPAHHLLLHLPQNSRERAIELALPDDPSDHQVMARDLLCG